MNRIRSYLLMSVSTILIVSLSHLFPFAGLNAKERTDSALDKSASLSKISKLSIPFIPNQGQIDKRVKFYANTFGGTVFVTETGEIVYPSQRWRKKQRLLKDGFLKRNFWVER